APCARGVQASRSDSVDAGLFLWGDLLLRFHLLAADDCRSFRVLEVHRYADHSDSVLLCACRNAHHGLVVGSHERAPLAHCAAAHHWEYGLARDHSHAAIPRPLYRHVQHRSSGIVRLPAELLDIADELAYG